VAIQAKALEGMEEAANPNTVHADVLSELDSLELPQVGDIKPPNYIFHVYIFI
jgi:hypothetical protein